MAQTAPETMSEHDQQLFEDMAVRIELTLLWTELSGLLTPGWQVPRQRWELKKPWHAYPLPKPQGERGISHGCAAALRNVNGTAPDLCVFTDAQVQNARECAINCLESRSNNWGDEELPWSGHRGAH